MRLTNLTKETHILDNTDLQETNIFDSRDLYSYMRPTNLTK